MLTRIIWHETLNPGRGNYVSTAIINGPSAKTAMTRTFRHRLDLPSVHENQSQLPIIIEILCYIILLILFNKKQNILQFAAHVAFFTRFLRFLQILAMVSRNCSFLFQIHTLCPSVSQPLTRSIAFGPISQNPLNLIQYRFRQRILVRYLRGKVVIYRKHLQK